MATPTPGPWTQDEELRGDDIVISGADGGVVALVVGVSTEAGGDDPSVDDERNANARLLAASWEMRELLRDIAQRDLDGEYPEVHALLARIDGTDRHTPECIAANDRSAREVCLCDDNTKGGTR